MVSGSSSLSLSSCPNEKKDLPEGLELIVLGFLSGSGDGAGMGAGAAEADFLFLSFRLGFLTFYCKNTPHKCS